MMSLLDKELSRRRLLKAGLVGVTGIGGALLLGCAEREQQEALIPWSTIKVPLNRNIRLEVSSLQSTNIGMTDLFIYSSAIESWSWFIPVIPSETISIYELDFYLAKYKNGFNINHEEQLLGQPPEELPQDSFLRAFGDLNARFSDLDLQSLIGGKSAVYAIQKPETQEPHVFVYKHREDTKTSGFLKLKLTFQPQEISFS